MLNSLYKQYIIQAIKHNTSSNTYLGDGWIFAIVDAQEGSKLQQQLCAHWGIAMDPCYKADLGLRRFSFPWFVGDFQSPNGSKLYALAQTGHRREETRNRGQYY